MLRFRNTIKLTFALLAVWLGLVWAGLLPRPAFLPPELDIEPLTFLLGAIAALLFGFWKNNDVKSEAVTGSHRLTLPGEDFQSEIRKYLKSRYEHRLAQKLAGRQPVNLRKIPSRTGTSDESAASFITLREEEVRQAIGDIFTQSKGRLLVVGLPGAGKTTLLLQLALELLERSEKVPAALSAASSATKVAGTVTSPIPVLLNLATRRSEFGTFDEWLQRILPLELGASKALAEKIRRNTPLILLLDGLDEVPEAERASCIEAIGQYGMIAENQYVISSRITEYTATKDAPVYVEVEVAPLTIGQVEEGLIASAFLQPESKRLLTALKNDSLLRKAVENPFYFNTAQLLFASGKNWSDFGFTAEDVAGRQREIVGRFVEDALGRKVKREYPKEKARKWLGFLAGKMAESGKMSFELVEIKPRWGKNLILELILALLIFGPIISLIGWGIWHMTMFIFYQETKNWTLNLVLLGIAIGIHFGLINLMSTSIQSRREILHLKWSTFLSNWQSAFFHSLLNNFRWGFVGFFVYSIIIFWPRHSFANLIKIAISLSVWFAVGYGIAAGIIATIKSGISTEPLLGINRPYQRFSVALKNLDISILTHLILRFALCFQRLLPLRLVHFLNEMSLRHLLEFDGDPVTGKGGGAWRWRHRILQEYFLEYKNEEDEA